MYKKTFYLLYLLLNQVILRFKSQILYIGIDSDENTSFKYNEFIKFIDIKNNRNNNNNNSNDNNNNTDSKFNNEVFRKIDE